MLATQPPLPPNPTAIVSAARRRLKRPSVMDRIHQLKLPTVSGITYSNQMPPNYTEQSMGYAYADPATKTIYEPNGTSKFERAHETFHVLSSVMNDADKARLTRLMGMGNTPWYSQPATPDARIPGEWGADWFAMLATGVDPHHQVVYGYDEGKMPTRRQLLRYGRALQRLGMRYNLPRY